MKYRLLVLVLVTILAFQCKQKEVKGEFSFAKKETSEHLQASTTINLENKGVGPIDSVTISEAIDVEMAGIGKELYARKCTACHKIGSTFIGPPHNGILERRTPEWVMNMILNPEGMLQQDSLAKALFMEFGGQLMTNQHITEEEARAILEYFRTLDH
ncbi:MAG: cytochrome c [Saprospiraceae bacterium]|nr:cytochrome c [Lewinella sp.]